MLACKIIQYGKILGKMGENGRTVRTEEPNYLEPEPIVAVLVEPVETGTENLLKIWNRNRRILEPTKH